MSTTEERLRRFGMACVAGVALAAAAMALLDPITSLDLKLLDARSAFVRSPAPATVESPVDVVVVGIDSASAQAVAEPMTLWHARIGRLLEGLRAARPAAVGLDIVLPERSYEAVVPGLDSALVRGLVVSRSSFPTILAQTVEEGGRHRPIHPAFVTAAGVEPGYALWPRDRDGMIRRFDERLGERGETVPTFAGQLVRSLGWTVSPGYLDYSAGAAFGYVPFIEVLDAIERGDAEYLRNRFEGRVVLVGAVMPFVDAVRVPVRLASWGPAPEATPGVLLQAHAVRALLADRLLAPVPAAVVALLALVAALAGGATARPLAGTAIMLVAGVAILLAAHVALGAGRILPVAIAVAAALGGWAARQGTTVAHRLRERRRLRRSFSGYVSPAVMNEILKGTLYPEADGEQRFVCLMFSDIRGYTTRSEGMLPRELLAFLNRYFDGVVDIIHRHGGTVACFMGDGIMAVFGAPKGLDNPCDAAFRASRAMLDNLAGVNGRLRAGGHEPIDIGIGLHAGEAVLGHVGGRERHDYSVIGDVTNVASRLESATKDEGYRIVMSDEVAARLESPDGLVPLGAVSLKGHTPVVAHGFDPIVAPTDGVRS